MTTAQIEPLLNSPAPDFELTAHTGETVRLSDYHGKQSVILFFVRTYNCYACRQHVEHLVRKYTHVQDQNAAVLVILNSDLVAAQGYADVTRAPFPVLADPHHHVYDLYGLNQVFLLSTRTGSVVVNPQGRIAYMKSMTNPWGWRNETDMLLEQLKSVSV